MLWSHWGLSFNSIFNSYVNFLSTTQYQFHDNGHIWLATYLFPDCLTRMDFVLFVLPQYYGWFAEANKVKQIKCFAKKLEHSCIENRACMDDLNYLDRLAAICRRKLCCNSLLLIFCVFVYLFRLDVTGTSRCLILPSTGWLVINTGFVTRLACTWWSSERECTQLQPDKKSSITLILR